MCGLLISEGLLGSLAVLFCAPKRAEMGLGHEAGSVPCWKEPAPSQSSKREKELSIALGDCERSMERGLQSWTAPCPKDSGF